MVLVPMGGRRPDDGMACVMAGSMTTGYGTVVLAWNGGSGVEMSGSVGLNPSKRDG